jgi:hypothetical protein
MLGETLRVFIEGCFIGIVPMYCTQEMIFGEEGYSSDLWTASFAVYITVIFANNIVCFLRAYQITWFFVGVLMLFSVLPFFAFAFMYDLESFEAMNISQGSFTFLLGKSQFILGIFSLPLSQ